MELINTIFTIPTETMCLLLVSTTVFVSCFGLIFFRRFFYDHFNISDNTNDAVNSYIASMGMLYGLLLGLVSVATWESFDNVDDIVSKEAASISQLYRNVSILHDPSKTFLQEDLKDYLVFVIDVEWPTQQKEGISSEGAIYLSKFLKTLSGYKVSNVEEQVFLREVFESYNKLIENRNLRILAYDTGIPGIFWFVIVVGGLLNILISYFVHLPSLRTHLLLTALYSSLLSLILFLLISVDRPLIGETSISSEAYSIVLNNLNNYDPHKVKVSVHLDRIPN